MFESRLGSPNGPFQISEPEYDYWGAAHSLAAERLEFAVRSKILLTVFTGETGSGKSTVLRKVVADNQAQQLIGYCSHGPTFNLDPCRAILAAFGADPGLGDKSSHLRILQQSLKSARVEFGLPTLVLDDAHHLEVDQFSNLFDLSGFDDNSEGPLFKIILAGRPELLDRLRSDESDLLGPSFALEPMTEKESAEYVKHRLAVAGVTKPQFDAGSLEVIYQRTNGNPHQINLLCRAVLDEATALQISQIDAAWVSDCIVPAAQQLEFGTDARVSIDTVSDPAPLPRNPGSEPLDFLAPHSTPTETPEIALDTSQQKDSGPRFKSRRTIAN